MGEAIPFHRYQSGAGKKDIRRLKHRISEKPVGERLIFDMYGPGYSFDAGKPQTTVDGYKILEKGVQPEGVRNCRL